MAWYGWVFGLGGPGARVRLVNRSTSALSAMLIISACEQPPTILGDAGTDAPFAEGGFPCTFDEECVDRFACTIGTCGPGGFCLQDVRNELCDDQLFCNGYEVCDAQRGCVPGPISACNDFDVCTIDSCDEATDVCSFGPRDLDQDGEVDRFCEGGTDCDDIDPLRGAERAEVCLDLVDNNCDDTVDETACVAPPHDQCETALDVSAGGVFFISMVGTAADYPPRCGSSQRDVALTFTLTEPRAVSIAARGNATVSVGLRTECAVRTSEIECSSRFPRGVVRRRSLEPGTYHVLVSTSATEVEIDVDFSAPESPPVNETCATAEILEGATGTVSASFVDARDDYTTLPCRASPGALDLFYSITLTETSDLSVSGRTEQGVLGLFLLGSCDSDAIRCSTASTPSLELRSLPAGTYIIGVGQDQEETFELTWTVAPPTADLVGESCAAPQVVELPFSESLTLTGYQDDVFATCTSARIDRVLSVVVAETSDLNIGITGAAMPPAISVRTACSDVESELRCLSFGSAATAQMVLRSVAPGTYFVMLEGAAGNYNTSITLTPPTPLIMAFGNDACADAIEIPSTGGYYEGNTTGFVNDLTSTCGGSASAPDAIYRFTLATSQRLIASSVGSSFDTVMHLRPNSCATSSTTCQDDSVGSAAVLDLVLAPGTYILGLDGFGTVAAGAYALDVQFRDP